MKRIENRNKQTENRNKKRFIEKNTLKSVYEPLFLGVKRKQYSYEVVKPHQ